MDEECFFDIRGHRIEGYSDIAYWEVLWKEIHSLGRN